MRKSLLPVVLAGSLALGGCTSVLPAVLGSVLQGGLGGGGGYDQGYGGQQFQQAAVNACGQQASRYGRVNIADVRQVSNSTLRVFGTVDSGNFQRRSFSCDFRSDGRITNFGFR
ncbi:MAG TPA: hypothetical protein VGR19_03920 [Allosphingosinicella sp.]|nr:hypothetical protein [Allosphingosinicella sp.]